MGEEIQKEKRKIHGIMKDKITNKFIRQLGKPVTNSGDLAKHKLTTQ